MDIEMWGDRGSGVLKHTPLLLEAAMHGAFGDIVEYSRGEVYNALFTFLSGKVDKAFFEENKELFLKKYLVCMSYEWEEFLCAQPNVDAVLKRHAMKPKSEASPKTINEIPEGYILSLFDEDAFNSHPFGHGANYTDYEDFKTRGSGAVVRYKGEIVASASSFLTFERDIELDVSTKPEHQRRGLADACINLMLSDCAKRGITVHWDAQNESSLKLAVSHGFELDQDYAVWILGK